MNSPSAPSPELSLRGLRISPGLASGTVWIASEALDRSAETYRIEPNQVEAEMERIRRAILRVETELEESARRLSEQLDPSLAEIFRAHKLMLENLLSSNEFEAELRASLTDAAEAVKKVFRKWEAKFAAIEDATLRQRADDILDLARRVLRQLNGTEVFGFAAMPAGSILVTERLLPSDIAAASPRDVKAIVVESVGQASHAALLAREKSIPVLAGLPGLLTQIRRGDEVLVDALREVLIISPTPEIRHDFEQRLEKYHASIFICQGDCGKPAISRDGQTVSIEANLTAYAGVDTAIESGADGVGLLRIEELYLARELPPSEEDLFNELQRLISPLHDKPVTIRLLDVGGDKVVPSLRLPFESNPLLGRRGVRVLLAYPQLARTQLRTLLRLSQSQDVRILVPMVTLESDMAQMRELLAASARELGIKNVPPLGAMIETPAAALTVGQIARHADFLSVGTNDLTQYTLAAGRDNATVNEYFEETHASMLRLLSIIIEEASGKPVTMCGELAGREEVIPTLLAVGFRALSISPPLIPATKQLIRSIDIRNLPGRRA
ncbi:MAG TPA: phosphoenolpyruvate--protein phosphotransferase [Candidatus Binatia bacterium]|nr:phosphoenolpyruvate--protein phosphotransferase [Candidatus Binatia bacterium]